MVGSVVAFIQLNHSSVLIYVGQLTVSETGKNIEQRIILGHQYDIYELAEYSVKSVKSILFIL